MYSLHVYDLISCAPVHNILHFISPSGGGMMPPPPPPPVNLKDPNNMTIRRSIQMTFKLPTVHWTAMKPNDTKDTIWYLMDDSKVRKDLDLASFEETFKLAHQVGVHDEMSQVYQVWNRTCQPKIMNMHPI